MRLIQRLAAGMCEQRAQTLRGASREVGQAARQKKWAELPTATTILMLRALRLHDELEAVKSQIARKGFTLDYSLKSVRERDAVTYKDAHEREKRAQALVGKRVELVHRLKERALRDTLGMSEKDGKQYLEALERKLEKV